MFIALLVILPWFICGFKFVRGKILENVLKSIIISVFVLTTVVYILGLLKIYYTWTLILALTLVVAVYTVFFARERFLKFIWNFSSATESFGKGYVTPFQLFRRALRSIGKNTLRIVKELFADPISMIFVGAAAGYGTYLRAFHSLTESFFGMPDQYVHAEWTKLLEGNEIFTNGVYPFGLHNLMSVFSRLFGIDVHSVSMYLGPVISCFFILSIYQFARYVFKSKFAPIAVMIFYCVFKFSDLSYVSYTRQCYTLPQDAGMLFLLPCGFFLFRYIRDKNFSDIAFFTMCVSLTLTFHFYITIVAAILCFVIFTVHFITIIKQKQFITVVTAVVLAIVISIAPYAWGLARGIKWEGSMNWALSVITGSWNPPPEETQEDATVTPEQKELDARMEGLPGETEPDEPGTLREKLAPKYLMPAVERISNDIYVMEWFYLHLAIIALCLLIFLVAFFIKKHRRYAQVMISLCIYSLILTFMAFFGYLGLPEIFPNNRLQIFFYISAALFLGFPVEIIFATIFNHKRRPKISAAATFLCAAALFGAIVYTGNTATTTYSFQVQYNGAIKAYYKIKNEHPALKWTIVSPVDETFMVRNYGWHEELIDFLAKLKTDNVTQTVYLPTDYVFFYVEKRPIDPYRVRYYFNDKIYDSEPVSEKDAAVTITELLATGIERPSQFYTDSYCRRVLEGKITFWVKEYMKYHPNEMSVYYEDDDIIVYKLKQNTFHLNNLYIDYGYND